MGVFTACCNKIKAGIGKAWAGTSPAEPVLPPEAIDVHPDIIKAYRIKQDLTGKPSGSWIDVHGTKVPSLASLLGRIHTPLDSAGFSQWDWYNHSTITKKSLTLPQAPTTAKTRVALNGVTLESPSDYSISGTQLTFSYPLEPRDWVFVKTFGA
jgi:hypothetical protein